MKRMLVLLLLLVASNVSAIEIIPSLSGSWYNTSQSGHGFSVEVLENGQTIAYWYTYSPTGHSLFLVGSGNNQGSKVVLETYVYDGMQFGEFDPDDNTQYYWGTMTLDFHACDSATLTYSSTLSYGDEEFGSGTIQLSRLTTINGLKCTTSPMQGNMHATVVQTDGDVAFGAAIMFANGDMAFFGADSFGAGVALGAWRETTPGRFSFSATVYDWEGGALNISGSGTYGEDGISASYTGGGELIASRLQSFNRSLGYQNLAGSYDIVDPILGDIGNVTIASDGSTSGSTIDGCSISGGFFIPDPQFNQAYFDADLSNCASAGNIMGAASYDFDANGITVAGSDGFYGVILFLE